jgi:hypothetical protein
MIDKLAKSAAAQPIQFAIGIAIVGVVGYFIVKRAAGAAAVAATDAAVGVITGNNALTAGSPYEGAGVLGTLGAAANAASGGVLQRVGESIGGFVFDVFNKPYDPSTGLETAPKTLERGAEETDSLWGRIGGVVLRAN